MTGDVNSIDSSILGTSVLMQQPCTTDYISISTPYSVTNGVKTLLPSSTICGLGIATIYSQSFSIQAVTDGNETPDLGNRGFYLNFAQSGCI
jgi:hypothetical protein